MFAAALAKWSTWKLNVLNNNSNKKVFYLTLKWLFYLTVFSTEVSTVFEIPAYCMKLYQINLLKKGFRYHCSLLKYLFWVEWGNCLLLVCWLQPLWPQWLLVWLTLQLPKFRQQFGFHVKKWLNLYCAVIYKMLQIWFSWKCLS